MVSSPHEVMHRIFQEDPGLFARTARTIGIPFADPVSSKPLPTDVTEIYPLERRIDTVLSIETAGSERYILAIEAQSKQDPDKLASWTYYLAYLYAKYKVPPVLAVVCQDRATARWAARHVDIGPAHWPALALRPMVLGPNNIPVFTTPDSVARDLPMSVLSAVVHRRDPEIKAILDAMAPALRDLQERDEDTAEKLIELTLQGLEKTPAADLWRELMAVDLSFFQSSVADELRDEGRAQGIVQGKAETIVLLLERRGIELSGEDRERVMSCENLEVLERWFDRAITATSATEVFAEPGHDDTF